MKMYKAKLRAQFSERMYSSIFLNLLIRRNYNIVSEILDERVQTNSGSNT